MSNEHAHPIFREIFDSMAKIFSPPTTPGHARECEHNVLQNGHYPSCGVGEGTHQGPCDCAPQSTR